MPKDGDPSRPLPRPNLLFSYRFFEISLWTYGAKRAHKLMSVGGVLRRVVVALGSVALVGSFFSVYAGSSGASGPATVALLSLESDLTSASFTVPTTAPSTTPSSTAPTTQPSSSSSSSSSTTSTTQPVAMTTIQSSPPTSPASTSPTLPPATIPSGAPGTGIGGASISSDNGVVLAASGMVLFAGLAEMVIIARRRSQAPARVL